MKCGELCHDLCTITVLTDYIVITPKYHGKIPVGDNRRGTGIVRRTYEKVNNGAQELHMRDNESLYIGSALR